MELNKEYQEKVYSGVLGKIIGVYLGRPFEGWWYDRIIKELGHINYYVNDKLNMPIQITDDDLTGTFRFINALKDFNFDKNISSKQIGQTWLNYCLENQAVLWWGGKGTSSEDTAYQNLKQGINAPDSGSIKTNGKIVAEQIGAQIFIDGWGLVSPGDPDQAADFAKKAGSVSHDGESVYAAQVVAAMEAMAFIEKDTKKIIEHCKRYIPKDSTIFKLISDIQDWSSGNLDWEQAREKIDDIYGYEKFIGGVHIVPNHALIILALLFGDDNFQKSLMIVNTSGWDTDCNSGNVGCFLGIKNGLKSIKDGPDYISPVNDTIYLPTSNGAETMTDALRESQNIVNITRRINGLENNLIKDNARYNFEMPDSTQAWKVNKLNDNNLNTRIANVAYESKIGQRALEIDFSNLSIGHSSVVYVDTFFPDWFTELKGVQRQKFFHYDFVGCPIVYTGQKIKTEIISKSKNNIKVTLFIKYWGEEDKLKQIDAEQYELSNNEVKSIEWTVPDTFSNPIGQIGFVISSDTNTSGKLLINYLDIEGTPKTTFKRPEHIENAAKNGYFFNQEFYGQLWKRAWVNDIDKWQYRWMESFKIINGVGRGHILQGSSSWKDYSVSSKVNFPLASAGGLIIRSQGVKRYYSLELTSKNKLQINKMFYELETLKEVDFNFEFYKDYELRFVVKGNKLSGYVDGNLLIETQDKDNSFESGMIGFIAQDGTLSSNAISIE
tara:strand:- start:1102 stop:3267 length:2166 start_codon:yes stop_codon:yes gene_type:complete